MVQKLLLSGLSRLLEYNVTLKKIKNETNINDSLFYLFAKPIIKTPFTNNKRNSVDLAIKIQEDYDLDLTSGKSLKTYIKNNDYPIIYEVQDNSTVKVSNRIRKDCTSIFSILWISVSIMNNLNKIKSIANIEANNIEAIIKILSQTECNSDILCSVKRIFDVTPTNVRTIIDFIKHLVEYQILENLFVFNDIKQIYDKSPEIINIQFLNERINSTLQSENKKNLSDILTRKFSHKNLKGLNILGYLLFHLRDPILSYVKSYSGDDYFSINEFLPEPIASTICYDKDSWKNKINKQIFDNSNTTTIKDPNMKKTIQLKNYLENAIQIRIISKATMIFFYKDIETTLDTLTNPKKNGGKRKNKSKHKRKIRNKTTKQQK